MIGGEGVAGKQWHATTHGVLLHVLLTHVKEHIGAVVDNVELIVLTPVPDCVDGLYVLLSQLYARVMLKEPLYLSRVRSCLEKALDKDPSYLPAAYLLAEIYEKVSISVLLVLLGLLHGGHYTLTCRFFGCALNLWLSGLCSGRVYPPPPLPVTE